MGSPPDLYERLGTTAGADAAEIRRRYLELVARYHPDRHQSNPLKDLASERLVAINAAYEVLSDPARRAAYDAGRPVGGGPAPGSGPAHPTDARVVRARTPARIVLLVGGAVLALRLIPSLVGLLRGVTASAPGRILVGGVLAALLVAFVVRLRARRSGNR